MVTNRKTCWAVAFCLTAAPLLVTAQTTVTVGSCEDWPSSITSDTVLQLTSAEISCDTNTPIEVSNGASLEMTSAEASTKLNNVKVWVQEGSFLCTVPMLDWTSVETVAGIHGFQVRGGAAMRTEEETTTTFTEDVTFNACALPAEDFSGGSEGAAVANFGTMTFQGNAIFKDTPDAGALYTWGAVTFEKDATFENNKSNNSGFGNGSGAGLYIDFDGVVTFKGASFFLNNEVTEGEDSGGGGAALYSRSSMPDPMIFSGPVTVSGNSGMDGTFGFRSGQDVIFESLATFTDNVMGPKIHGDSSSAGAVYIGGSTKVEFRGGVTATGNIAKNGGAFVVFRDSQLIISSPAVITGNEARYAGGAIWVDEGTITLPADADISGNTATICPGINYIVGDGGAIIFEGGETYSESSKELCYMGSESDPTLTPTDIVEEFDCEAYSATAPVTNEHPYLVLDTAVVKSWDFGSGGGFSCETQLIVYVTGGEELTITSTAAATTMANVHFEVVGYTSLIVDVPDLTVSGIFQSRVGGAIVVDAGSSLDVMNKITFQGNSLLIEYDQGLWESRGGAAVYSDGTTVFHGRADFLGNGQYDADANGYEPSNEDGGALSNSGSMTFMQKGTFTDNFNPNGGNGGAIANFGDITFKLRAIFKNNSVGVAYTDDGEPYGGRGGAVWNAGESSTILFNRLAIFKNNVGALGGCALATRGYIEDADDDDLQEGDSRITFADKAKFKDNSCDGDYPTIYSGRDFSEWADENKGGGALLAYGATTIEFADTAVFKRNEAANAGAIRNSGLISFVSDDKLFTADNVATETCPDILNNDVGIIMIGTESFAGPSAGLCERAAA